jgi:hypothetical protein
LQRGKPAVQNSQWRTKPRHSKLEVCTNVTCHSPIPPWNYLCKPSTRNGPPISVKLSVSWQTSQAFRACPTGLTAPTEASVVFAVHCSVGRTRPAKPLRLCSVLKARCIRVLWQKAASALCRKALAIGKIGLPSGGSTCPAYRTGRQTPGCCGSAPHCAALLCRHPAGTQFVTKPVRFLRPMRTAWL